MNQSQTINISTNTIIKVVVVALALFFIYTVREVAIIVFVALVLAAAIDPSITTLERRGVPRNFGIAIIFISILAVITLILLLLVPLVIDQLEQLTKTLPDLIQKASNVFRNSQESALVQNLQQGLSSFTATFGNLSRGVFSGVVGFFGGLFSLIGILVLTFYLTMEEKGLRHVAYDIAPVKYRPYMAQLFNRVEERLGRWLRGQLTLGLIIAVMTFVGLTILKVKFALVLALIAGVTELVPIVGPLIGAVPAIIVAMSQNPILGLWVAGLYLIIQQTENHFIVPRVMSKAAGLNPVIVIVALLVGAKIAGLVGVILSVPTIIIINCFLEDFMQEKRAEDVKLEVQDTV